MCLWMSVPPLKSPQGVQGKCFTLCCRPVLALNNPGKNPGLLYVVDGLWQASWTLLVDLLLSFHLTGNQGCFVSVTSDIMEGKGGRNFGRQTHWEENIGKTHIVISLFLHKEQHFARVGLFELLCEQT